MGQYDKNQQNNYHNKIDRMLKSQQSFQQKQLRYDINNLLQLFNQIDSRNQSFININQLYRLFNRIGASTIGLNIDQQALYQFDDILSFLGILEAPQQPSIYVLSFVKILTQYRNKCIQKSEKDERGLAQAKQIGQKIKLITKNELERTKKRLLKQHYKIYEEMNKTQTNQFQSFEQQWTKYLYEFKTQTQNRIEKVKNQKIRQLSFQSSKLVKDARKHSLITSPKLIELLEKKKWLIKQGRYADAIQINYHIDSEKKKIQQHKEESLQHTLRKRVQSMKKKNESALTHIQESMNVNMNKLIAKKKQGEHLMQLRMKNLRDEAEKKLSDHLRGQLGRLKALFMRASR